MRVTLVTVSLALLLTSCDPGFEVVPVGWQKLDARRYEQQFGDLRVQTAVVGGLIGEWWAGVDFLIIGADKSVTPKAVVLITPAGRLLGKLRDDARYLSADAVSRKGAVLIGADWDFPKDMPLPKSLGESPSVEVSFLYGGQSRKFTVSYRRE